MTTFDGSTPFEAGEAAGSAFVDSLSYLSPAEGKLDDDLSQWLNGYAVGIVTAAGEPEDSGPDADSVLGKLNDISALLQSHDTDRALDLLGELREEFGATE